MGLFDDYSDNGYRVSEDMPRVVRQWHKKTPQEGFGPWAFAFVCGLIGLALVFGGCAMSVGVTGVRAAWTLDPGKLAPLVMPERGR